MAVVDQGGGGGRAGGDTDDNYALDKPYDITGDPTTEKQGLLDEMLNALFKALARARTSITTNASSISDLSDTVDAIPTTAGVPTIVNQYYYAWMANYDGSAAVSPVAVGTFVPIKDSEPSSFAWVQTFTIPYLSCGYTATTAATRNGWLPSGSADGGVSVGHGMAFNAFMATGTPTASSVFRYWFGMFDQKTALTGTSDTVPAANFCAFRYSTTASDVNWMAVVRDGVTEYEISTGVAYAVETEYRMSIVISSGVAVFTINETSVTVSTNVPATSVALFPIMITHKDASGSGKTVPWYFNRMIVRVGTALSLS